MLRILIDPSTYRILDSMDTQNPFVKTHTINHKAAEKSHALLAKSLRNSITYKVTEDPKEPVPDIVFAANGGA